VEDKLLDFVQVFFLQQISGAHVAMISGCFHGGTIASKCAYLFRWGV